MPENSPGGNTFPSAEPENLLSGPLISYLNFFYPFLFSSDLNPFLSFSLSTNFESTCPPVARHAFARRASQ